MRGEFYRNVSVEMNPARPGKGSTKLLMGTSVLCMHNKKKRRITPRERERGEEGGGPRGTVKHREDSHRRRKRDKATKKNQHEQSNGCNKG